MASSSPAAIRRLEKDGGGRRIKSVRLSVIGWPDRQLILHRIITHEFKPDLYWRAARRIGRPQLVVSIALPW
jgi:hypothetical protein